PAPVATLARPLPKPMLATRADARLRARITAGEQEWSYEMKWDGIRAIAQAGEAGVRGMSRRGQDLTATYPELAELASLTRGDVVVDGEIVALNARGTPDFGVLQRRMNLSAPKKIASEQARTPVYYFVFDLLQTGTTSLVEQPYEQRRAELFDR